MWIPITDAPAARANPWRSTGARLCARDILAGGGARANMAARCSRAMAAGSEFGALLRRHRLAAELTQAALAERALLSTRGVQHLEAGLGQPYPDTVRRLSDALGLAPDDAAHFEVAARTRPRRNMADTVGPRVPSPFVPTGEALVGRAQVRADIEQYLGAVGPPLMLLT